MDGIWKHCCVICINIAHIPPKMVIYNEKIKYLFSLSPSLPLSIVNKLNGVKGSDSPRYSSNSE